jgi:hypothetical protein
MHPFPLLLLLMGMASAPARQTDCEFQIERDVARVADWSGLKRWYATYGHCDNAIVDETVADFVTHRLATRWDVAALERAAADKTEFRSFVIGAVDATADYGELRAVIRNASTRCPKSSAKLCASLSRAAADALKEAAEVDPAAR